MLKILLNAQKGLCELFVYLLQVHYFGMGCFKFFALVLDFPIFLSLTIGDFAHRYSSPGSVSARADTAHPPDHAERPAQEEARGAN